ncbi:MAG: hypothetical protein AAGM38_08480 [Pseudomonadota bacterium]
MTRSTDPKRRPAARRLACALLTAASLSLGAGGAATAQDPLALLCAAPAQACAPTIAPACAQRLGAGAQEAEGDVCADQLGAYRACLMRAVRQCGGEALSPDDLSQMARAAPVALDRDALFAAPSITISLDEPPRPPGLTPAEIGDTLRCRKSEGCATQFFFRYHRGQLIFDIDQSDPATGALAGWLPQSASAVERRGRLWRNHSGEAEVSGDAVVITGRIYTDGVQRRCAITLIATSARTLAGVVDCRGLRPIEATAAFEASGPA